MQQSVDRITLIMFLCALLCTFFSTRLFFHQVVLGPDYAPGAVSQRSYAFALEIARGQVLDRNMIPLTDPRTRTSVIAFPHFLDDIKSVADEAAAVFGSSDAAQIESIMSQVALRARITPVEIAQGTTQQIGALSRAKSMPGIVSAKITTRYGPRSSARHVVGYIVQPDNSGASGIEKRFDSLQNTRGLKGRRPRAVAPLVDGTREIIPGLGYRELPPSPRASVVLTLDVRMQRIVEAVLDRRKIERGAVVVLDPSTGEVLAMASRPTFDQNDVAKSIKDPRAPLINRALEPFYPGSVFKVILAAAALESGAIHPLALTVCSGIADIGGGEPVKCTYHQGKPAFVTFRDAMAYSCNPVFISLAEKVGAKTLVEYARAFGIGSRWPELPEGSQGMVREPDSLRGLAHLALGHEFVKTTPLELTAAMSVFVSKGVLRQPYLVRQIVGQNGKVLERFEQPEPKRVTSTDAAQVVRQWLETAVKSGTGRSADIPGAGAGGKTGTPENARSSPGEQIWDAWFVGWTPLQQPRFVIGVFVEEGHSGPGVAAPLFKEIGEALNLITREP